MLLFHTVFQVSVLRNVFQFDPRIKQNLNLYPSRPIFNSVGKPQLCLCYAYSLCENYSNSQNVMEEILYCRILGKTFSITIL